MRFIVSDDEVFSKKCLVLVKQAIGLIVVTLEL